MKKNKKCGNRAVVDLYRLRRHKNKKIQKHDILLITGLNNFVIIENKYQYKIYTKTIMRHTNKKVKS